MHGQPTAEEMVEMLPLQLGMKGSMKSQLLLCAELLRKFTDTAHGLSVKDIRSVIKLKSGKMPSESKILSDLHELADNEPFGTKIEIPSRGESRGFRCTRTFLTSEQARLVLNMVRTCKFITPRQRTKITEALHGMVSYYQEDEIVESVYVDERDLPTSPNVFEALDVVYSALKLGKMISFKYAVKDITGNEFYLTNANGDDTFIETPISLVYSFGNYYAETWATGANKRMARRLDKVRHARIADENAFQSDEIDALKHTVRERISQQFDMWGDDIQRTLFLRVKASAARYVFDRLGAKTEFHCFEDNQSYGYLCLSTQLSPTFYRWIFGMRGRITIAKPLGSLWVEQFWNSNPECRKNIEDLLDDYNAAMQGLEEHVRSFLIPYGYVIHGIESV